MREVFLAPPFNKDWKYKDPFKEIQNLKGVTYRKVKTRHTLNFQFGEESFYIKVHEGTTIKELIKNLLSLKLPVFGARNEFQAIKRLHMLGVETMKVVAFGERGINPLKRESFLITRDLNPAISLEDYCKGWKENPPSYEEKKVLIETVAKMVREMHRGGVNHRDCYICHFLLKQPWTVKREPHLAIIDLHRAQIRDRVPVRWRDKDLIALYYSSSHLGLSSIDYARFLIEYFDSKNLREILKANSSLFSKIKAKAKKIEERTRRKGL